MNHHPSPEETAVLEAFIDGTATSVSFFRITETMVQKSIIDANAVFRTMLSDSYNVSYKSIQVPGTEVHELYWIGIDKGKKTEINLYRPKTKMGDPRLWIRKIRQDLVVGDLLIVGVTSEHLWATTIRAALGKKLLDIVLVEAWTSAVQLSSSVIRLKEKIEEVMQRGWVPTLRGGDTGVGFTLETCLGIAANSSRNPDFEGIEIKAKRGSGNNLQTLFGKSPDWSRSTAKSTRELVNDYGYYDDKGRKSLYCTVNTSPNNQNFALRVLAEEELVSASVGKTSVLCFPYADLRSSLELKHQETFFVTAETSRRNGLEYFRYNSIVYCRNASFSAFIEGILLHKITLDLTAHIRESGKSKDHGYLWRSSSNYIPSLYKFRQKLI
jgi:hypothetical protein